MGLWHKQLISYGASPGQNARKSLRIAQLSKEISATRPDLKVAIDEQVGRENKWDKKMK